jgi:3'(2'), 5'-bisphosphate nucleotidase
MNYLATSDWNAIVVPAVLALAKEAGSCILTVYEHYKSSPSADVGLVSKADDSPLTKADLASHVAIVSGLAQLTPEIPVVSEESADSLEYRLPVGRFWLIDPLDGTKEFLARNDEFTVNIALIEDGSPVWGVVYAPALDLLYWGGRDSGAYREFSGQCAQIHVAGAVPNSRAYRVVASKSHLNSETVTFIERLGEVTLIQAGSSLKLCRVAEGSADVYPRLAPTCEWDTAAAQAVVEGAGGSVVDLYGHPLVYGKPNVLNPHFIVTGGPFEALPS